MQIKPCVPSAGRRLTSQAIAIKSNKTKTRNCGHPHVLENKQLADCLANASALSPQGCLNCALNAKTMGKDTDT